MLRLSYIATLFIILTLSLGAQTTIKICALRVDFQEDNNTLTTGNGKFMIDSVTTKPFAIDPAPHDRTYFNDQLIAAANYFQSVSGGQIILEGDVYPVGLNEAYTLPHNMGYYNPNTGEDDVNAGLTELFQDALEEADQDNDIQFNDYDLIAVFHAGVGKDIDVGFDETPQDIPSLYLTEEFFKKTLGSGFTGFSVDDGTKPLKFGIMLPETENQVGYQIALTGMIVSNIGTHLGLSDLFSPSDQRSGVGRFDLMDVGLLNLNGLAPSPPGAYSRERLGWSIPRTISTAENGIEVARLGTGEPEVVKIPINDSEYYLLEYRGLSNVNIDSLYFELYTDRDEEPSYLEVLSTFYPEWIEVSDSSGVLLKLENYDIGLPGSGILIWHIDQRIINEMEAINKINDDPDFRGVDIEEADGSQDIGESYNITQAGFQSELGTWLDFWYKGKDDENIRPLYKNEFSTFTSPNTRSNLNNAISHITINNFSSNLNDIMTFDYSRNFSEESYPLQLPVNSVQNSFMISGSVTGKSLPYNFFITDQGNLGAFGTGGSGLLEENTVLLEQIIVDSSYASVALMSRQGSEVNDILIAGADSLYIYDLAVSMQNGMLTALIDPVPLEDYATGPVVTFEQSIYVPVTRERYAEIQLDGRSPRMGRLPGNNTGHITDLFVHEDQPYMDRGKGFSVGYFNEEDGNLNRISYLEQDTGGRFIRTSGTVEEWDVLDPLTGPFSLADMDNNGRFDIIYNSRTKLHIINQMGNPVQNFPVEIAMNENDSLRGCPLLADIDGDGSVDILTVSMRGLVTAYSSLGEVIAGFPLNAGATITGSPVITNWDTDSNLELSVILSTGVLYTWSIPLNEESELTWSQSRINSSNNALVENRLSPRMLGKALMPSSRAFNYPNPNEGNSTTIRYYLNEEADVKIRIIDTAGILVDDFKGPGMGGIDNEIEWDVAEIASGVYLCQIEARGSGKKESKIIKIMVVH